MATAASDDLAFLGAVELGRRIAAREVTSLDATRALLARIARLDPRLHAYETVTADLALAQAEQADRELAEGKGRGPLHGVPVAVKDLCDVEGTVTAAGMALRRGMPKADKDSTVVARLKDAGCVLVGKLQLTEGAYALHHPEVATPINPWDPELCAGMSSSGSGVATAAGLCYASLGSDTLGSIRFPSSMNGVTGLKVTWGRVPKSGVFPLSESLDTIGPMARSAEDAAAVLGIIAGATPEDPAAARAPVPDYLAEIANPVAGMRLGIDRALLAEHSDATMQRIVAAATEAFAKLGIEIVDVKVPPMERAIADASTLCGAEVAVAHADTYPSRKDEYGPGLSAPLEAGHAVDKFELAKAWIRRPIWRGELDAVLEGLDGILLPAWNLGSIKMADFVAKLADPAFLLGALRFTGPVNFGGHPSMVLPGGFGDNGAPAAFQIVGHHFGEAELLRLGHAYQQATDHHKKRPGRIEA
ncbi:amidase [Hyaloraphidium curvatum]|nr:amidase [Hyaloraphidium curvatum]